MSEIVVIQRAGRWLVYLSNGGTRSRIGGFETREMAEAYAETIASASVNVVDAAAARALASALREAEIAAGNARKWIEERDRAIVAALDAGASLRAVGAVTGLSAPTISKIGKRAT